jgi:F-type H+-transporting ATPase subunit gamma
MASLREIRRKIKSVRSTEQITKAMKMIAAARMRRAQASILSSRPFAQKMEEAIRDLAGPGGQGSLNGEGSAPHPFFETRAGGPACLLLVTGDRGLCGAFNTNALKACVDWLHRNKGRRVLVVSVGRKGRDFLSRLRGCDIESLLDLSGIFPKASFAHAEIAGNALISAFAGRGASEVAAIYNEFRSVMSQRVVERTLLPVRLSPEENLLRKRADFRFEPEPPALLGALLPRHLKAQVYQILLESQAAELAARMNAMDSASKNAGELIDALTLTLNRTRQSMITREIAELVGGAEALAS